MSQKQYIPIGEERVVVETIRWFSDDPTEAQKQKDELVKKYGSTTQIEKYEYDKQEWSWRTDGHYTVHMTEYRVSNIQPIYTKADQDAMWKEWHDKRLADFRKKYEHLLFKKT